MKSPSAPRQTLLAMLLYCLLLMRFNSGWVGATAREASNSSPIPHTLTGDIRFVKDFHSRFLEQDRDIVIYLPPGYDKSTWRRYPVLYMQDGQNLLQSECHPSEYAELV